MRKINYIVLHCTAGPQTQTVETIKSYWKEKGWKSVGYHVLITPDGVKHKLSDYENPTNGVQGHNSTSIHFSYVGGVSKEGKPVDNRTEAQKQSMKELVEEAHQMFPDAVILGHRDFSPDKNRDGVIQENEWIKACPSFSVKTWLQEIGLKAITKRRMITVAHLNLRTGAGTNHPALEVLPTNATLYYLGTDGNWTYVQKESDGKTGWVMTQYLKQANE